MGARRGSDFGRRTSRWRAFRRWFHDPVFQKLIELAAVIAFAIGAYFTTANSDAVKDISEQAIAHLLSFVMALLWAVLAFMCIEFLFRFTRSRHDRVVSQLVAQDEQLKSVLESVLDSAERFEDRISRHPALRSVIERHRARHLANLDVFFSQYSALDLDVDEQEEQRFTVELVDVAKDMIRAVSVKEEQFWTSDMDGSAYLRAQKRWLEAEKKRRIVRVFVTEALHDRSLDREPRAAVAGPVETKPATDPPVKRMWEDGATINEKVKKDLLNVLEVHWAIAEDVLEDKERPEKGSRYEVYVVPMNVWVWHRSENTDLVIYDHAHVKRGPLTDTEMRKALFRSSDAARLQAENEFGNLLASSVLASQFFSTEFAAFQEKRKAGKAKSGGA